MFSTNCQQINQIYIPQSFSDCTIDLPVYYKTEKNLNKIVLYMTKSGVLRNTSTIKDCDDDEEIFDFGKLSVKRTNKSTLIQSDLDSVNLVGREEKLIESNINKIKKNLFFKLYIKLNSLN